MAFDNRTDATWLSRAAARACRMFGDYTRVTGQQRDEFRQQQQQRQ
jgi:hypothetical protein